MTYRPQVSPEIVIPNAAASPASTGSMATSINGAPTIVQKLSMISYQFLWSGTSPVGAVSVQFSNDFSLNSNGTVKNAGTWTTATLNYQGSPVTSIAISGNSGNGMIDIDATGVFAVRPVYTATSGVGTLQVTVCGKVS